MAQQKQQCSTQAGSERGRPRWAGPPVAVGFAACHAGGGTGRGKWTSLRDAPAGRSERGTAEQDGAVCQIRMDLTISDCSTRTVSKVFFRRSTKTLFALLWLVAEADLL